MWAIYLLIEHESCQMLPMYYSVKLQSSTTINIPIIQAWLIQHLMVTNPSGILHLFHVAWNNCYNASCPRGIDDVNQNICPVVIWGWISIYCISGFSLQWRHNEPDGVSNLQSHDRLLSCLLRRRSKKTSSSASLAFVRGIHWWPVNSPHKGPVTRKMFPFDNVIMDKSEYTPGIIHSGCPAVREKSGKFQTWQKSGKSQGILLMVREKMNFGKSQGKVREFAFSAI